MVFVNYECLALVLCLSIRDKKSTFYGWPEELIRLMVDKIYTCSHCAKCMIPFEETYNCIPSIGATPWHYIETAQGWEENFGKGRGCTILPGDFTQDGIPELEEFYDGMPICKFFELWGFRRWRRVYTLMLDAEGKRTVEFDDDFYAMVRDVKRVQAWQQH